MNNTILLKQQINEYISLNYTRRKRVCKEKALVCDSRLPMLLNDLSEHDKRSLKDIISHIDDTFQKALFYFIDRKGLDEVKVYSKAHIDRRLFSKIRSDENFKPSKKTAICLCIGLELNLDEAKDLLNKAGYTLSHASKSDLIVEYFINNKIYDLDLLNQILYEYKLSTLYI